MDSFRASGDDALFEELLGRHRPAAWKTALAILRRRDDAEDAVQEAFLHMVRARRSWRPGRNFRTWFFAILRNVCRDALRRARHSPMIEEPVAEPATARGPHHEAEARESARAAARALARMPRQEREVLSLRIHGSLEFREIAAACRISEEAAKKRAGRALERLRRMLAGRS
jgi:RNA polymerase sigma-70 factor (ECF subfamily)